MPHLERALRELESATAALAEIPTDDFEGAKAALSRRSLSIARVTELAGSPLTLSAVERQDALRRLRWAWEAGAQAQTRLAMIARVAMTDWNQWNRIYRALGESGEARRVDWTG